MPEMFSDVGSRIQQLLQHHSMKQAQLARETAISPNAITYYIKNKRLPDTASIYKIAKVLSSSVEWILTGEGEMIKSEAAPALPSASEYAIDQLNNEQKELLMLFDHLNDNQKYAVKDFIAYQFNNPQSRGRSLSSPPRKKSSGGSSIA